MSRQEIHTEFGKGTSWKHSSLKNEKEKGFGLVARFIAQLWFITTNDNNIFTNLDTTHYNFSAHSIFHYSVITGHC
jgi:hypothetical protein